MTEIVSEVNNFSRFTTWIVPWTFYELLIFGLPYVMICVSAEFFWGGGMEVNKIAYIV